MQKAAIFLKNDCTVKLVQLDFFQDFINLLTGVQLEEELDREVVEVAAVLNDLDERSKPTLARRERGDGDGAVELSDHWGTDQGKARTTRVRGLCGRAPDPNQITNARLVTVNTGCTFIHSEDGQHISKVPPATPPNKLL